MAERPSAVSPTAPRFDLGVIQVLELAGLKLKDRCRFVRHQDWRYRIDELRRNGWFELYQSYQSKPVFHQVDQLVSFYGLAGTRAGFYGVYDVHGCTPARDAPVDVECPMGQRLGANRRLFL